MIQQLCRATIVREHWTTSTLSSQRLKLSRKTLGRRYLHYRVWQQVVEKDKGQLLTQNCLRPSKFAVITDHLHLHLPVSLKIAFQLQLKWLSHSFHQQVLQWESHHHPCKLVSELCGTYKCGRSRIGNILASFMNIYQWWACEEAYDIQKPMSSDIGNQDLCETNLAF